MAHLFGVSTTFSKPYDKGVNYTQAVKYVAANPQASLREVGRAVEVKKDTIKRWKGERDFHQYVKAWKSVLAMVQEQGRFNRREIQEMVRKRVKKALKEGGP